MNTPLSLTALERLVAAGTPGEWIVKHDAELGWPMVAGPLKRNKKRDVIALLPANATLEWKQAHADLIAAAHNALPRLLAVARAARAVDEHWSGYGEDMTDDPKGVALLAALRTVLTGIEE